jgi:hypothetical protein
MSAGSYRFLRLHTNAASQRHLSGKRRHAGRNARGSGRSEGSARIFGWRNESMHKLGFFGCSGQQGTLHCPHGVVDVRLDENQRLPGARGEPTTANWQRQRRRE